MDGIHAERTITTWYYKNQPTVYQLLAGTRVDHVLQWKQPPHQYSGALRMPTTTFVWDPVNDCVISELDGTGATQAVYTNEPQQYGGVLSQRRGSTSSFLHADALGTTRLLTSTAGATTDTCLFDAWGNPVVSTGTTVNPFKWVGRYGYYTDSITGLIYVRARMYAATIALWVSIDPQGRDGEASLWSYGKNGPVLDIDPSGLVSVRVEHYSTDRDGPLHCQSKEAGVAYRFTLEKWPCRPISTHILFIQKVSITYEFSRCCSSRECKDSGTFYEFFKEMRVPDLGAAKAIPSVQDNTGVMLPGDSFDDWSGYYQSMREEIRAYCIVPDNTRGKLRPTEIRDSEVVTTYSTKQWQCFSTRTRPSTDQPPGFWSRSRGVDPPPARAGYWLGFQCCRGTEQYIVQSSRPS